jgi:hypothetical protein
VTISERIEAGRRERRVPTRVSRAGWRLEQAERERVQARVSARAEGVSPASSTLQLERAWDAWQAERYWRGEISQRPGYAGNPFRLR